MKKAILRVAMVGVAVLGLAGCAGADLGDTLPSPASLAVIAPAAGKTTETQLASTIAAPKPAAVKVKRITYIVRKAPVLTGRIAGSCRWSRGAQGVQTAYRPAPGMLAPLSARRPVYRFTNY